MTYFNHPCRILAAYESIQGDRMRLIEVEGQRKWIKNPIIVPGGVKNGISRRLSLQSKDDKR